MSVARRKGAAGRSDVLFSRIVRSRGVCERCGLRASDDTCPFDTAHIVPRRYSATRCVEDNAWCLCRPCHQLTTIDASEHVKLAERTIGRPRFDGLWLTARGGYSGSSAMFWRGELTRLMARCEELGIDTRTSARFPWAA